LARSLLAEVAVTIDDFSVLGDVESTGNAVAAADRAARRRAPVSVG
jgi:hypothetical protein